MKPRILIVVSGGAVVEVITDIASEVTVIDHDTEGCAESELTVIPATPDEPPMEARVFEAYNCCLPAAIDRVRHAAGLPVAEAPVENSDQFFG